MGKQSVAVVDYSMGNVWSVISALKYLGVDAELIADPDKLIRFNSIILPGVGSFRRGMESLTNNNLDEAIHTAVKHNGADILGICLGMQLLGTNSCEDGDTEGLGLVANNIDKFNENEVGTLKIPHVGFNPVNFSEASGIFSDLPDQSDFYFVHSYRMLIEDIKGRYATCNYGIEFLAGFEIDNICGTQFHPEKSQTNGLILLKNFLEKKQ